MAEGDSIKDPLLRSFVPVAKGIAEMFGPCCEVVLHDLRHPRSSVVLVLNGHVTGRKVGEGIRDFGSEVLTSSSFKEDVFIHSAPRWAGDRKIKSMTIMIRDGDQMIVGALCINYDLTGVLMMKHLLEDFSQVERLESRIGKEVEIRNTDVLNIMDHIIEKSIEDSGKVPADMNRGDMVQLVRFWEEQGVFLIKGAVEWVAGKLGISKFTVYSYLKEVRIEREIQDR